MFIRSSHFTIKPVTEQDLDSVLTVYRQCEDFLTLGPEPQASMTMVLADLKHSQEQEGSFCGIHDPAGTLVGVIDVVPHNFAGNPTHAFITLLMIGQPFRQRGLGSQVVEAMEQELGRNPQVEVVLSAVQVNNSAGLRFWQRQGYYITSDPTFQTDGTITVTLKKLLAGQSEGRYLKREAPGVS